MTPVHVELGLPSSAAVVVDGYLAELSAALPAGRAARSRIVTEVGDGLACAVTRAVCSGDDARQAAMEAVSECGDPHVLAAAFAAELAPTSAGRTGVGLLLGGPLVGLVWVAALGGQVAGWTAKVTAALSAVPVYPLILAVVVPAAIVAVAGSGRLGWRMTVPGRLVPGAAVVAVVGCVCGDVCLVSAADVQAGLPAGWLAAAVAASVLRTVAAGLAARRVIRLRVAAS